MPKIEFKTCPLCSGYGVLDNGDNCRECGGVGSGGLYSQSGCIGSGELMYYKATGRRITTAELVEITQQKLAVKP